MIAPPSDALVLFGVSGDLAHKKIFPALYAIVKRGVLKVPVIGVTLPKWSLERLRRSITDGIRQSGGIDDQRVLDQFLSLLNYVSGDYNDRGTFTVGNNPRSLRQRCVLESFLASRLFPHTSII